MKETKWYENEKHISPTVFIPSFWAACLLTILLKFVLMLLKYSWMSGKQRRPCSDAVLWRLIWVYTVCLLTLSVQTLQVNTVFISAGYFMLWPHAKYKPIGWNELGILTSFISVSPQCSSPLNSWKSGFVSSSSSLKQTLCETFQTQVCISILYNPFIRWTKNDTCTNSLYPDETPHNEPSHQDLLCLPFWFWTETESPFLHQWKCPNSRMGVIFRNSVMKGLTQVSVYFYFFTKKKLYEKFHFLQHLTISTISSNVVKPSVKRYTARRYLHIWRTGPTTCYFRNISDLSPCCKNQRQESK